MEFCFEGEKSDIYSIIFFSRIETSLSSAYLPPAIECGNVMFSVMSVCHSVCPQGGFPMWPHMDLFRLVHFGTSPTTHVRTLQPWSNLFTWTSPPPDLFQLVQHVCSPYIYRQAGGWPLIERLSCLYFFGYFRKETLVSMSLALLLLSVEYHYFLVMTLIECSNI